jgi:hypothetical protein
MSPSGERGRAGFTSFAQKSHTEEIDPILSITTKAA